MTRKIHFNDALDYIFITNDSGKNSYLITSDIEEESHRVTNAISVTAAAAAAAVATAAATAAQAAAGLVIMGAANATAGINGNTSNAAPTLPLTTSAAPLLMSVVAASVSASASAAASSSSLVAAATASGGAGNVSGGGGGRLVGMGGVTAALAAAADGTVENLYDVAINLGAMLINNQMLQLDGNGTFDDTLNGTQHILANISLANGTAAAAGSEENLADLLKMVATSAVLGLMILITIIGNVFVIAAIILERNLQNVANYLVASLAVADLFVACLVMPLGAVYEISEGWILGPELCDIWTSCDVLCCTASILHLVAIAVDRYWAVTNIDYIHSRTSRRVMMMIICVWSAAVIVSLAPQFGWKDPDYLQRIEQQKCMVSQDVAYQVFATCCTFYVPLLVILALYWKIYQTARKRIHRRRPKPIGSSGDKTSQPPGRVKKRRHLRLRLGKFSSAAASSAASAPKNDNGQSATTSGAAAGGRGRRLMEGNSTNTINTVEDTEFSSSNVDGKSRAGVEIVTNFRTEESEVSACDVNEITNLSNLVALASQQRSKAVAEAAVSGEPEAATTKTPDNGTTQASTLQPTTSSPLHQPPPEDVKSPTAARAPVLQPKEIKTTNVEVLQDPHIRNQQQQPVTTTTAGALKSTAIGTSNATTTTSISAISPQTPKTPQTPPPSQPMAATYSQNSQLSSSANASSQVTPVAAIKAAHTPATPTAAQMSASNAVYRVTKRKETLEAKRERKAAKTLAIITGAFVVCWLPFFVMALMMPLCEACEINDSVASFFLWLGYFNSTLNPVIYTIFSPEFRQAFKRILFGGHRPVHYRSGKI